MTILSVSVVFALGILSKPDKIEGLIAARYINFDSIYEFGVTNYSLDNGFDIAALLQRRWPTIITILDKAVPCEPSADFEARLRFDLKDKKRILVDRRGFVRSGQTTRKLNAKDMADLCLQLWLSFPAISDSYFDGTRPKKTASQEKDRDSRRRSSRSGPRG